MDKMLRLTLCVAILAVASAVDLRNVVPEVRYKEALRTVAEAHNTVKLQLLNVKPPVNDPLFHYLLVLGQVDETAELLLREPPGVLPKVAYAKVANLELPKVYLDPVKASQNLESDLLEVKDALKPLLDLVAKLCKDVDDDVCDKLVQLEVERLLLAGLGQNVAKAVATLKEGYVVSSHYLGLHENLRLAAEKYSGLGFALNNVDLLTSLSSHLKETLKEARRLLVKSSGR